MTQTQNPPRRWNPWPVSIIVFFTLAILGCGSFIAFCSMQRSELVAPDYYEQEVRFQNELDSLARAKALAPAPSAVYDPESHRLVIDLAGSPRPEAPGRIDLYRASSALMDRHLALSCDTKGRQSIDTAQLAPGPWTARMVWSAQGRSYQLNQTFVVASTRPGA